MRKALLLLTAMLYAPAVFAASTPCTTAAPNFKTGQGTFETLAGKIYQPDGTVFVPRGINILEDSLTSAASNLTTLFPGINFVRVPIYNLDDDPAKFAAAVQRLTSQGVVVEFEDHTNNANNGNAGGGAGTVFTGQALTTEQAFYSRFAAYFKANPYVWYGTNNEPPDSNLAALAQWQKTTYDTIRATGNNNPIMLEISGYSADTANLGLPQSDYSGMHNTYIDAHFYGQNSKFSTDVTNIEQTLAAYVKGAQRLTNADGVMPVIIGEYGDAMDGNHVDVNGNQTVQAVQAAATLYGVGSVAWMYQSGPADALLSGGGLSAFGQSVAAFTAQSGSTGCASAPLSLPITVPSTLSLNASDTEITTAANATDLIAGPSIADVATLASQGVNVIGSDFQLAHPLTTNAPDEAMVAPAPVSNSTSFSAPGSYQTVVPGPGNATGTVSGNGNTIDASSGIQTITVTGSGNTITTGLYDDTITVKAAGNTIDGGGGNDTVILAYGGKTPSSTINADAAAVSPLANSGNIIVAPSIGMGTVTIQGVLAANDKIDLTHSLAGTTWDGSASTMWNYVTATTSPQGCVIAINGRTVAILSSGSSSGNIGPFITAHSPT